VTWYRDLRGQVLGAAMTGVFLTFAKPMIRFFTGGSADAEKTMAMSIACVRNLVCRFAMDQNCCLSGFV
jgi:hypothetical protein